MGERRWDLTPAYANNSRTHPNENPCWTVKSGSMNKSWVNLDQVKVALRNQQVLTLLLQECSNRELEAR